MSPGSPFAEGDSFLFGDSPQDLHLHVVICGPTPSSPTVIVVTFNTVTQYTDSTIVLQAGDHAFINRETAVSYNWAEIKLVSSLTRLEQANAGLHPNLSTFKRHIPVDPAILRRIQQGAVDSPLTPKHIKREVRQRLGL